jgi:hypothetical protein
MPVTLVLRRSMDQSPFRRLLLGLVEAPKARSLILGSGYIWEPPPEGKYHVLDDELGRAIQDGCSGGEVTLIAGMLRGGKWLNYYENFVRGLSQRHPNVVSLVAPRKNWHAKVAIRHDQGQVPIAALVGSSNLTGPAYKEPHKNWNYECDTLIWPDAPALNEYFRGLLRGFPEDHLSRLDLILDPAGRQPSEAQQIEHLRAEVLVAGLKPFKPRAEE